MFASPSRIVAVIVGGCLLLTLLVLLRSGSDEPPADGPRPGSSIASKPKPGLPRRDNDDSRHTSSDPSERPNRVLPGRAIDVPRPALPQPAAGKVEAEEPTDPESLAAVAGGRNLAAEPLPAALEGAGVVPLGGGGSDLPASPEALAAIPSAPEDASLAVPFDGNGESLGSTSPLYQENVVYDLGEGAYFPPNARFAFADSGSIENKAGTIAFWLQPKWDGADPRNVSLLQYHTQDWSNRLQIYKNGVYLRYVFTGNTGSETNVGVDISGNWFADDWHHIAITWGDAVMSLYLDGNPSGQETYIGELDVPSGTELYVGSESTGTAGADAVLEDFVVMDRSMDQGEIQDMYAKGRNS